MPVITLYRDRFSRFVGRSLTVEEMAEWLPWIGFEIEERGADYVKIEFNPNRVDFSSYAGVSRAFQGLREWRTGLPEYVVHDGDVALKINRSVNEVRPYMLGAIIRNIELDEAAVRELMEIQEDLHWSLGRDRRKASIGVHNLNNVNPPFTYLATDPDEVKFVALGYSEEMSLREILDKHEKGLAYKHLIEWSPKYPLLIDSDKRVLSMPPIINGELTRVDEKTRNLFIDVTGPDSKAVKQSLNVLVTALADMGGTIESIHVKYQDKTIISPDLTSRKMKLRASYANELLGLELSESEIVECLRKCRLDARKADEETIEVEIPVYRIDILHEVDLVEEIAIGYGYYKLKPTKPKTATIGSLHEATKLAGFARQTMIGLGFTEVMNFILTNGDIQFTRMKRKPEKTVKIANPASSEYNIARTNLLPSMMKNLMDNKHESFPQRIFEVSDVIKTDMNVECRSERNLHIAGLTSHSTANFTEIKSIVEALLANLGLLKWKIKPMNHPSFVKGRVAKVQLGYKKIGYLGEIHPEVLNNFELENPVCGFEVDLEYLLHDSKSRKV